MAEELTDVYINAGASFRGAWPSFLPKPPEDSFLDSLFLTAPVAQTGPNQLSVDTRLKVFSELSFVLPVLSDISFVVGGEGGATVIPIHVDLLPDTAVSIVDLTAALRIRGELLKPVRRAAIEQPGQPARWEVDPTRQFVDIQLSHISLRINGDGDIDIDADTKIDLPPAMIGDSGIVIQARDIEFHFNGNDPIPQQPVGFRGIHLATATLSLPGELGELVGELALTNAFIGNGGFSGDVSATFNPAKSTVFNGLQLSLQKVDISLKQNAFVSASMLGSITVPYFDQPLDVEIGFTLSGDFTIRLASSTGLLVLSKPNVFDFTVESLTFQVQDNLFQTIISGQLKPTLRSGEIDWPAFEVKELAIDSDGHVRLEGGWLNLPHAFRLSFYGFQFEVTKLGFGKNDAGGKWLGINGALRLVDGIQAGASVEGLRLTWYDDGRSPTLSFDGVGIELEIPNSLRFKGFVAFRELQQGSETVRRFDGAIKLELLALDLTVDAQLVFGHANSADGSYNFLGIFLGVELPAGIPLFATGLGLYGMAGLFASQLAPNKAPDEQWYGVGPSDGWYKRPQLGVTDLVGKWTNKRDALGLGMGVTIGTLGDNGYAFSGRVLLLLLFPGPVIMIEGRANILKERSKLADEPLFRTLAVLDFNVGTFLFGVDAQYRYDDGGKLIELSGSAEAYFNLNNPGDWHFWLGQRDPKEKRIRARIFQLFDANAYFMLDASSLAMGAWFGYSKEWHFSKLKVSVELWSETNVGVSWRPPQFTGGMRWHGGVHLSAFGIGVGFSVEIGIAATVFDPFHVKGDLHVELNLPWPLPDLGATVTLEWGPEKQWPKVPLPLSEAAVEHLKVSTAWLLPRAQGLLAPNYDSGNGLRDTVPATPPQPASIDANPPPMGAPVVPMDARPRLTFSRPIQDEALVGVNVRVTPQYERIGDPSANVGPIRVKYSLREVSLQKWLSPNWVTVARKAASDLGSNPTGVDTLYGSWAPIPDFTEGDGSGDAGGAQQVKLWLWSANPFDYTRRVGRSYDEWFTGRYANYPCLTLDSPKEKCYDFESIPLRTPLDNGPSSLDPYVPSYRHPQNPSVELIVDDALLDGVPLVQTLPAAIAGRQRGVCFAPLPAPIPNAPPPPTSSPLINSLLSNLFEGASVPTGNKALLMLLPTPNVGVRVEISRGASVFAYDSSGVLHSAPAAPRSTDTAEILGTDLHVVVAYWNTNVCFAGVCLLNGATAEQVANLQLVAQHNVESVEHFEQRGFVLDSRANYRLRVVTLIDAIGEGELSGQTRKTTQTEYAFFQTQGPPKLVDLSLPIGQEGHEEIKLRNLQGELVRNDGSSAGGTPVLASDLNDLAIYVKQTLPATVPASGEKPDLPRPVYRAYDLGTEFNENYVQLMYRLDARDLALYLFDQNNAPIRDAKGRLLVLRSGWDVSAQPSVDSSELVWMTTLQLSTCFGGASVTLEHDESLKLPGVTLEPDTIYDARLNPLLIHEDFSDAVLYQLNQAASGSGAVLGRWTVEDQGGGSGASNWVIAERGTPAVRFVRQTSNYFAGSLDGRVPDKLGTLLWLHDRPELGAGGQDQPSNWTNYRLSAVLRAEDDDAIGLVFRRSSDARYYRFSLDRERKYRRLTRHVDGVVHVLAEDEFVYQENRDYEVVIEAIDSVLTVFQDGEQIFSVSDGSLSQGTIGLYCWGQQGALFEDIRVDDFRSTARSAFLYRFTTSKFSNFAHEIHSYQDETWTTEIDAPTVTLLSAAVPTTQAPSPSEHRAWDALEAAPALDSVMRTRANELQVTSLVQGGATRALLLRSPEPIDVNRTQLTVSVADTSESPRAVPLSLKLIETSRHASDPNQESVLLMVRDQLDPSSHVVEQLRIPPVLFLPDAGVSLLDEQFQNQDKGHLYDETFGPNTLDLYEIADQGASEPSSWSVSADAILQSSGIFSGPATADNLEKFGTTALRGRPDWGDVRIFTSVLSNADGSVGLVFRYRDADNYYRFELNRQFNYRRLVKRVAGVTTLLWEDSTRGYQAGQSLDIEIVAAGARLIGFVDRVLQFVVEDASLELGRVGLYTWANSDTRFELLSVVSADRAPLLLSPPDSLNGLTAVDQGLSGGPSQWQVNSTGIVQTATVQTTGDTSIALRGTTLIGGQADWSSVRIAVRVTSSGGHAVGILFRYTDESNYYRFSMDSVDGYRRLIKQVKNESTVLWEDATSYAMGEAHDLTLLAQGTRLRLWLDGTLLFDLDDAAFASGRVGLYTRNEATAVFEGWTVLDEITQVGRWEIVDEGQVSRPSDWRIRAGVMQQRSDINDGSSDPALPEKLGTMALTGDPDWDDYRIVADVRAEDDDALGVVFRYRDANNYYRLSISSQDGYRRLIKKTAGVVSVLAETTGGYLVGVDFRLTVEAIGQRLRAFFDTTKLFDVSDPDHAQGRVGLYTWADDDVRFDSLRIDRPTLETRALFQDRFAAGDVSDWSVLDQGTVSAPSQWALVAGEFRQGSNIGDPGDAAAPEREGTYALAGDPTWNDIALRVRLASGDDGALGVLFRYTDDDNYYRFSTDRQGAYRRLVSKEAGVFRVLWQDPFPYVQNQSYELLIVAAGDRLEGYLDGVLAFRVTDAQHTQGRIGLYSSANTDARFAKVDVFPSSVSSSSYDLEDRFLVLKSSRWTFEDEGTVNAPSVWDVDGDRLVQTSAIRDTDATRAQGTNALAGDDTWDDYRLSAAVQSTSGGAVGILFRASSAGYYRFALDRDAGALALVKRVGSSFSQLFSQPFQLDLNVDYVLSVECIGSHLTGFVNGVQVFSLDDSSLPNGRVGLYAHGDPGARFDDVIVVRRRWVPFYRFGKEDVLPAGTRLRVVSGGAGAAVPTDPLEVVRYVAPQFEHGEIQLPAGPVDLRVMSPTGPGHQRRFLSEGAHTGLDVKLLRRADGTGYAVVPSSGNALQPGEYRLRFDYRRDGAPQTLSERGVTAHEIAQIDVPLGSST